MEIQQREIQSIPVEFGIKRYRNKKGVYFIKCYDGICKIGQSDDLRIYWDFQILSVWETEYPLILEQQLHLFLSIDCQKSRKGKYELFKYTPGELTDLIDKCNQKAISIQQQICQAIESGINLNEPQEEQINTTIQQNQNNNEQSVDQQISDLLSNTCTDKTHNSQKVKKQTCNWYLGCTTGTTHQSGYCYPHREDSRIKNSELNRNRRQHIQEEFKGLQEQVQTLSNDNNELKSELFKYKENCTCGL